MKKRVLFLLLFLISLSAKTVYAETFDGEYSTEYLLKNYSIVTLDGNIDFKEHWDHGWNNRNDTIDGNILVNGDVISNYSKGLMINSNGPVKSFIKGTKGDNVTITSQLATGSNYIDFSKLRNNIINESKELADKTEYVINDKKLEISKPGIYQINNTAIYERYYSSQYLYYSNNRLLIKNYDKNSMYVFNYYNEVIIPSALPYVYIMETGSQNAIPLKDYIESGQYTGNVIFNFPNAKSITISHESYYGISLDNNIGFAGNIIAPKATIFLGRNYYNYNFYYNNGEPFSFIYSTLIAKDVIYNSTYEYRIIKETNLKLNNKLDVSNSDNYYEEINDYDDDFYSRDYSIADLLQNYSLVTLGHKNIDSKSKLLQYGNTPGSIRLFHITGQALINGNLYGERDFRIAFDLVSNKVNESFIAGSITDNSTARSVIQPWDNMDNDSVDYWYSKNNLIVGTANPYLGTSGYGLGNYNGKMDNYINFDRLYNNIVAEQKKIDCGKELIVGEDGVLHIPIGGNYTIEDISNVTEVVFDHFDKNKDELTIVTIKNSGDVNFPLISKDGGPYKGIVTNDYFGKERATHLYEANTFISEDSYYGNIVWNVPNATYIKLKENAPFAGHLIAPNADVETPETHFAGCFIVNSIYGEGNTEAHFYPITAKLECDCSEYHGMDEIQKMKFSEYRLRKMLGGDGSTIESNIVGNKDQYNSDVQLFEAAIKKCDTPQGNQIVNIITNPKTYSGILIVIVIIGLLMLGVNINKKKKIQTN